MSSKPLANKVALVTGSGRGLGRSHALLLAALGAKVMVNDTGSATTKGDLDVTEPVAQQVAELIRSTGGEAAWTATSAVDGAALVRETVERFGRLDILVANAGVLRSARLERMSDLNFDLMWKVNMLGAYSAVRAAIPIFLSQGYGRVVLTASTSGIFGSFGGSNYGTCKNALAGMIAPWASFFNSLAPAADISISALCPMAATRMGGTVIAAPPSPEGSHPDLVAPTVAMMVSQEEGSRANGSIYHAGQGWYGRVELEPRIDAPRVYLSGPAAREAYKGLHVVVMGTGGKSLTELSGRMEKAGAKIVRVDINKGWSEDGLRAAIDNELGGKVHLCMFDWSEAPLTTTHPFPTKPGQPDPEFRAALADFQQLHEKYLYSTFKVCRLLYGYMRKQNYGRFVSFVRVDMGNEALGVIGPEWNSVAYGIQGLFQVLSIESEYFDFDIAGSSLYLHPLATVDSQNEGVRPGACLPVVSKMLEKGYRGRDMVIFNGTPYAYRSSPGSFLDIPAPGSAEKFGGLMFEAGAIMAQTVDGWDRASDVYAEGSFYPKDEPEASSFGSAHSRAWLRKHFPDYQPPEGLGQHGKKGSYDGGPKL